MTAAGNKGRRLSVSAALAACVLLVAAGCSVEQTLPPPWCDSGGSSLIVAQSVRSASQIPCLLELPAGWGIDTVQINEEHSVMTFDSDRAGAGAAVLRLEQACDVSEAVSAPSDLPAAERFESVERVAPSFRAERYYVFPGGCVSWTFDFDEGTSATESVSIGSSLVLFPRQTLQDNISETFVDEEL